MHRGVLGLRSKVRPCFNALYGSNKTPRGSVQAVPAGALRHDRLLPQLLLRGLLGGHYSPHLLGRLRLQARHLGEPRVPGAVWISTCIDFYIYYIDIYLYLHI